MDNPTFKAFSRATTNRLIFREQAAAPILKGAEFYVPVVPQEPGGGDGVIIPPSGTITVMLNFDHELEDRSGKRNHAIAEFTNQQLLFTNGMDNELSFAVNFNPNSNDTYDKLWIPFSNSTQIIYDTANGFSIFARIKPLTLQALGGISTGGSPPPPRTNRIQYYGGPVLNKVNVAIHNIFWGNEWNDSSTPFRSAAGGGNMNGPSIRTTMINTIFPGILNSQHYDGLWSYGWPNYPKKPVVGGNITHTSTSLPGGFGSDVTIADGFQVVKDCISAGTVPNPDTFAQDATDKDGNPLVGVPGFKLDYNHIYFIHIPPSRGLLGAGGVAAHEVTAAGNHFLFNLVTYYPPGPGYTTANSAGQAWAHEIFHHLAEMSAVGGCAQQGYAAFYYNFGGECNWIQHSQNNLCGSNVVPLSGNSNVTTEHYWSDIDGKCIAPGSGESWTPPPATGPITPVVRRYIFQKMDDLDNGATAAIGSDGAIYFNVKKAGIEYKCKSAAGAIRQNEWADCWFIFDTNTNTPRIHINNTLYNTASTEVLSWNNTHSHFILGNRNLGASIGQFRGAMDDFRLYRGAIAQSTEIQNMTDNGLTVTSVPQTPEYGVFVANRFKVDSQLANTGIAVAADVVTADVPSALQSFTTTSFTSTSFTI